MVARNSAGSLVDIRPRPGPFAIPLKEISGPSQRKIQVVFKADADQAAILGAALVLAASPTDAFTLMEDNLKESLSSRSTSASLR
jgi:hypothetical protein